MAQAQAQKLPQEAPLSDDSTTPLMAQYLALKARHMDCLLFFRLGDFYEMFFEDAQTTSRALGIALTRRGQHQGQDIPMCGVPAHSYESYVAQLIKKGHRVAVCEQSETPEEAKQRVKRDGGKAIVTRDVVRIITPGTVTEDSLLEARASNYLACLVGIGNDYALAWLDLASGQPATQLLDATELSGALARIDAAEILVSQRLIENADLFEIFATYRDRLTPQPQGRFDSENAQRRLHALYKVSELSSFGDFSRAEVTALGALLEYVELTQKCDLVHLARPQKMAVTHCVAIDPATRRNLELTRTLAGEKHGSLLSTIDRTLTGAGARLICSWLVAPSTAVAAIAARHDAVEFMTKTSGMRRTVRSALQQSPDLERAVTRLTLGRGGPRDLAVIRDALGQAEEMREALLGSTELPVLLRQAAQGLGQHPALIDRLGRALADDLPMLARDGNFIRRGYAPTLDEFILLRDDSRQLIASLQHKYAGLSAVPGLKIRHNNVIGYYIEVTPMHADKLLAQKETFIHRQTLASAARFTTVELGEIERKITEAADKALALELQLFGDLVREIATHLQELRLTASSVAEIDAFTALAELAVEKNYVRPVVDDTLAFEIKAGRHPVVEEALRAGNGANFVANDCDLAPDHRLWLLTGPNMAGKSTFLRQNAVIALLAQMGSFVPASSAHIGVIDRLFSRVGASDDLARGHSTFMVEMVETAAILNQAGDRALVILDEIGRGTATYDGLSIAWATMEHLHEVNKCRALFATHYHELTCLTATLPSLSCHTMKIKEWEKEIIFLHEVVPGVADRSYGIHVARMAGLPKAVIARADEVLRKLEAKEGGDQIKKVSDGLPLFAATVLAARKTASELNPELKQFLAELTPDDLTPRQALEALYALKKIDPLAKE